MQVVPLTSATRRMYPSEALVYVGSRRQKAMADQITTAAKHRLTKRLGILRGQDMDSVERAFNLLLGAMPRPDRGATCNRRACCWQTSADADADAGVGQMGAMRQMRADAIVPCTTRAGRLYSHE